MAISTPSSEPPDYALHCFCCSGAAQGAVGAAAINLEFGQGMTPQTVGGPFVSILVPAYNAASSIAATLRSALGQSYPAIEVIVVDDGSQDETAQIVQRMADADKRLRLIRQANQGVASARNTALAASRGSLIAPLDADDLWYCDKITRQVRRFAEGGDGPIGVVYCWSSEIDADGRIIVHRRDRDRYEGNVLAALVVTNFIDSSSVPLISRAELEAVGGWDTSLHAQGAQGCEDWQLYIRLAQRCNFALESAFLVGYRQSPGAMSRNVPRMWKSYRLVMAEVRRTCPGVPAKVHRWSKAEFNFYTASLLSDSAPIQHLLFLVRGIMGDPVWLLRSSTRRKLRMWISSWRRRKKAVRASGGRTPSVIGLPFDAFVPEPESEISEGRWIARRRRWLSALGNKGVVRP